MWNLTYSISSHYTSALVSTTTDPAAQRRHWYGILPDSILAKQDIDQMFRKITQNKHLLTELSPD